MNKPQILFKTFIQGANEEIIVDREYPYGIMVAKKIDANSPVWTRVKFSPEGNWSINGKVVDPKDYNHYFITNICTVYQEDINQPFLPFTDYDEIRIEVLDPKKIELISTVIPPISVRKARRIGHSFSTMCKVNYGDPFFLTV